jgi:hypothetical protein
LPIAVERHRGSVKARSPTPRVLYRIVRAVIVAFVDGAVIVSALVVWKVRARSPPAHLLC